MIIADTSAMLALLNSGDAHHEAMLRWYEVDGQDWVIPWAVLPELDYLLASRAGADAQLAVMDDVATGNYRVDWGETGDMRRAAELAHRYHNLRLGLVDAVVMAIAERRKADAIATLDLRHFGAVRLKTEPLLIPRDG